MADILSHLYLVSAALKQFEDQGRPAGDLPLLRWSCETSLLKIQESFDGLFRNLPSRPAAWLLRRLVFPAGPAPQRARATAWATRSRRSCWSPPPPATA